MRPDLVGGLVLAEVLSSQLCAPVRADGMGCSPTSRIPRHPKGKVHLRQAYGKQPSPDMWGIPCWWLAYARRDRAQPAGPVVRDPTFPFLTRARSLPMRPSSTAISD